MGAVAWVVLVAGQIPTVTSKEYTKEMQTKALTATVMVLAVDRAEVGTGVVIGRSAGFTYVLTANHVIDGAKQLEVSTYTEASYPKPAKTYKGARVLAQSPADDLAVLRLVTEDGTHGELKLGGAEAKAGFKGLTVGCGAGDPPTCELVTVNRRAEVRKPGAVVPVPCWELSSGQKKGRSGGPLIDREGRVVGIASMVHKERGYCSHAEAIVKLLRNNGLRHLIGDEGR